MRGEEDFFELIVIPNVLFICLNRFIPVRWDRGTICSAKMIESLFLCMAKLIYYTQ